MSTQNILNEDWSDYDDKKKKHADARFFACTEDWEVDYLINKIIRRHPFISRDTIKVAIRQCCTTTTAPHPRDKFVDCVMKRLGLA